MDFFPTRSMAYSNLDGYAKQIERLMSADVFTYFGEINPKFKMVFVDEIENLAKDKKHKNLLFNITTHGGSAEMVEVMVDVMRNFYEEVYFVIPDYAYSAGTILCMSGDKIFMNYYSSLGPIDPQITINGRYVSAQGYIDQFDAIKEKSIQGTVSPIEIQMALNLNLADLNFYEQAKNLTVSLLKKWLVQYKFKDWHTHSSNGTDVTPEDKEKRAEEIAVTLGNNALWNSHGRHIGINTLRKILRLKIENLADTAKLEQMIKDYHQLVIDYTSQCGYTFFIHSRKSRR